MRLPLLACLLFPLLLPAQTAPAQWQSEGVVYVSHSPYAKLHTVPIRAVKMGDGFWAARRQANVEKSIPTLLAELEQHGVVDNFLRLEGKKNVPRRGPLYTDSDIYKWMEAVAFVLQSGDQPKLRAEFDRLTDIILAAQEPSGYLNTYWSGERASERFTEMYRSHELYCLGHLLQAAIAYYRATGNRKLLDGGIRFADYMVENFGPRKRPALTGHPELEMAMVELYRTTGDRRYLNFAGYLLSGVERERLHLSDRQIQYMFSGEPFTARTEFEGHAVRAMYASCGAADYYAETGDPAYLKTLETLWKDLVTGKMYITGGVGSREAGEAFGEAYELPNAQAYGESCAAIGNMMWNWRMLLVLGESRFADVMERALYNGINSGMSLSGTLYCYRNPLESSGEKIRNEWYDTTCCPPNLERILASLPGYLYSTSPTGVYVNLFHNSELDWHLENGAAIKISQKTEYPWKGAVDFTVSPAAASEFSLFVRIPAWSETAAVTVNGQAQAQPKPGEYYEIHRRWEGGDKVRVEFDVKPRLVRANPLVREDAGRVAVEAGPLVFCLEQPDQPGFNLFDASLLLDGSPFAGAFHPDLLDGVEVLEHRGAVMEKPLASEPLYLAFQRKQDRPAKEVTLSFIPYYAWANRGPSGMEVWVPYSETPLPLARNRAPLPANAFDLLPLTSVKPRGWLRRQLQIQADGLSGHLGDFWPDVGPNSGWLGGTGESWERGPYYLDGLVPLAYELNDPTLIRKVRQWVDWTLDNQRPDGAIGPQKNKDWWPNMLMLKVLTQYQEATGDPRVIPVLTRYFAYQVRNLAARPLYEWARFRWADELLSIVWLYNRTGDASLLDLARRIGGQGYDWKAQFAAFPYKTKVPKAKATLRTHGVNNAMALKTSAVWSLISGDPSDRRAVYQMLRELDEYHLLPSGVHSADEHYAGTDPSQGTELCAVVEAMFSLEHLISILGDPAFGDRLEKIAFNPLPGTFTADMWAHQYDQQPNQIQCDVNPRAWETNGPDSNLFGLEPNFGCCTANMHQGWPKFAANLWMSTPDNGLAAVAYAPSEVRTQVGNGTQVSVVEDTEYPFRDTIRLTVNPAADVAFPLQLRIPSWAAGASVKVNGQAAETPKAGTFYRIERQWRKGDVVDIVFPMHVRVPHWYHNSISLERGPLIYSLKIGEKWKKLAQKGMTADWEVDPTTPWNYGLIIDPKDPDRSATVEEKPVGDYPFSPDGAPVILKVKGRAVPEWTVAKGSAGPLPESPVRSTQPEQTLTLIPYGAAKLRITAFPWVR